MKLTTDQIKTCGYACVNTYKGLYGKVREGVFDSELYVDHNGVELIEGRKDGVMYIVFRGTDGLFEWISNFQFFKRDIPYEGTNPKIKVHSGFMDQYRFIRDYVHDSVEAFINKGGKQIIISGHSRGAATATLCAVDIQFVYGDRLEIACVPVASPRVGNREFKRSYDKRVPDTYRYVYRNDIVTKVPTLCMGFVHVAKKLWLSEPKRRNKILYFWKYLLGDHKDHYPEKYADDMEESCVIMETSSGLDYDPCE
jgi:predicted lipase